jgi:hypothetical protein
VPLGALPCECECECECERCPTAACTRTCCLRTCIRVKRAWLCVRAPCARIGLSFLLCASQAALPLSLCRP